MEEDGDKRRLFEYFIVAGLNHDHSEQELVPKHQENASVNLESVAPITDICVIFTGSGETVFFYIRNDYYINIKIMKTK
jgi:hypothetical protein